MKKCPWLQPQKPQTYGSYHDVTIETGICLEDKCQIWDDKGKVCQVTAIEIDLAGVWEMLSQLLATISQRK